MIAVHSILFLIPPLDPWWEAGFHLGSQVACGIPGQDRRDPTFDPRWEVEFTLDPG